MTPAQAAAHNLVALRENLDETVTWLVNANLNRGFATELREAAYWEEDREKAQKDLKVQLDALFEAVNAPCLKCAEGEE